MGRLMDPIRRRTAARDALDRGMSRPYDAVDGWDGSPLRCKDWAHAAARGIVAEMTSRFAGLDGLGQVARVEIVETIAEIVREARRLDL